MCVSAVYFKSGNCHVCDVVCSALCFVFQLANMILPEDENFLLIFRREAPLDNSVDFMKVNSQISSSL